MVAVNKKTFFGRRTPAQIVQLDRIEEVPGDLSVLVRKIEQGGSSDGLIIQGEILPSDAFPTVGKFKHHGGLISLPPFSSVAQARATDVVPVEQRVEKFSRISAWRQQYFRGYAFRSAHPGDQIPRVITLVSCVKGAKLFTYGVLQPLAGLEVIAALDDAAMVEEEGAVVKVMVPSRNAHRGRYTVQLNSVPVVDSSHKQVVASSLSVDHDCEEKKNHIRFVYAHSGRLSKELFLCPHTIAAYYATMAFYAHPAKRSVREQTLSVFDHENHVPLQMNPFVIPTQFAVSFYEFLDHNCVIEHEQPGGSHVYRHLNDGEKEAILWTLVKRHPPTFTDMLRKGKRRIDDAVGFAHQNITQYRWGAP
ncbi:MAG: hypothetical protein H6502_02610 [Candidatus Woesearchaeota archaeon]|nr:MAG: hypothetical protein H6502_02610 [Candidatus Woesearchaeota archaeon]